MKVVALSSRDESVITAAPFMWRSSDTTIAIVDDAGTIFGLSAGSVTISAELDGHTNFASLRIVAARVDGGTSVTAAAQGTGQVCALGNGSTVACLPAVTPDSFPILATTPGAHPAFASLSATYSHMCGLTAGGQLHCAGSNRVGELGTGRTGTTQVTDFVHGAANRLFSAVTVGGTSASAGHTCAIERGTAIVFCGGNGASGQTGHEPNTIEFELIDSVFTPVEGNLTAIEVSAGRSHTCAIGTDHDAYCWGANAQGVAGVGVLPINIVSKPSRIPGGHVFAHISAGSHACAVTTSGAVFCWGSNQGGQLGNGTKDSDFHTDPVPVSLPSSASIVFAGNGFSCALVGPGDLYCWGTLPISAAFSASLGTRILSPMALFKGLRFTSLSADASHLCAVTTAKSLVCL
jgi:alpha-tubulin suppressor-like RCC1 family protein